jgi:tetratricopeptide (TPR) repeat protein
LQLSGETRTLDTLTDCEGNYRFSGLRAGTYFLHAERAAGGGETTITSVVLGPGEEKTIDLRLGPSQLPSPQAATIAPEFFDQPQFTVAGVTDTTNLGGHGSGAFMRNREALTKAEISLSKESSAIASTEAVVTTEETLRKTFERFPKDFEANFHLGKFLVDEGKGREAVAYLTRASRLNPTDYDAACELARARAAAGDYADARTIIQPLLARQDRPRQDQAELHHLLGDVEEGLTNPLEAVQQYQLAAGMNPTEQNFFDWGTELLVHHAAEPAIEVFDKGRDLFPHSVRMLIGLGVAWYAQGSYDEAMERLCEASDMDPVDPTPYLFLGKVQSGEKSSSAQIVERLARFVTLQPDNAMANYYYAVSLSKSRAGPKDVKDLPRVQSLLETAVRLDPKLGVAYLQLGILFAEKKDLASAISSYQNATAADPRLEEAHYRLARAYRQAGDSVKARKEIHIYEQLSKESAGEAERERHEIKQFVYTLRGGTSVAQPQ